MDSSEAKKVVAMVMMAFPNSRANEQTAEIYASMLVDLEFEPTKKAVRNLLATARFMPAIAEIRSAVVEICAGPRKIGGEAWGDVNECVRKFGRYQAPEFTDPLVAECVKLMGWLALCDSTNDAADRARFIELYDGLAARGRTALALPGALGDRSPQRRLEAVPGLGKIGTGGQP